jgi:hypothetical protein
MTALSNASREQLVAWARLGGEARAAKLTAEQRRQSASKAAKALRAKMTPEQVRELARRASQA